VVVRSRAREGKRRESGVSYLALRAAPIDEVGMTSIKSALLLCCALVACSSAPPQSSADVNRGIDSLNVRIVQAYRTHDPKAYAALFTDSAVFEWPAFNTVRGTAGLEAMAASNWASLRDMDLGLTVSSRRLAGDHATEFGAFTQSWRDSSGARMAEYGRYVSSLVRQRDGTWRMDRFFGFSDSTRQLATRR
jgi:ketosteroid isomerase-like protein